MTMRINSIAASVLSLCLFHYSCQSRSGNRKEKARQEISQAEKDFEKMAAEKGIAEAFWYFADSNAVIKRDSLVKGKENIRVYYSAGNFKTASVTWSPDFTEASEAGDLGYTFGKYLWQSRDSTGKITEARGVFHTVWKKQKDGSWKYVWD
jgi:ketosteroid isomerase-like protein